MRALWIACVAVACGKSTPPPVPPPATKPDLTPVAEPVGSEPIGQVVESASKPISDDVARDASKAFLDALKASRADIGRCHDAAVATDAKLNDRVIKLTVAAAFTAAGTLEKVTLNPFISGAFEACVRAATTNWKVTVSNKMTFQAELTLAPPSP